MGFENSLERGPENGKQEWPTCTDCSGKGYLIKDNKKETCKRCNGSGKMKDG
jgi:DnaJ-class molecular chaperone